MKTIFNYTTSTQKNGNLVDWGSQAAPINQISDIFPFPHLGEGVRG
jgi:hypothetical protein